MLDSSPKNKTPIPLLVLTEANQYIQKSLLLGLACENRFPTSFVWKLWPLQLVRNLRKDKILNLAVFKAVYLLWRKAIIQRISFCGCYCCCCCCGSLWLFLSFYRFCSWCCFIACFRSCCFYRLSSCLIIQPVSLTGLTSCKRAKPVWWRDDRNTGAPDQEYQNQIREFIIQFMLPLLGVFHILKTFISTH